MLEGEVRNRFIEVFEVPDVAKSCLEDIVSPIEQELVVRLDGDELTLPELADRWQPKNVNLQGLVDQAYKRGILEKQEGEDSPVYKSTDFYTRLDFFAKFEDFLSLSASKRAELDEWYLDSYTKKIQPFMKDFRDGSGTSDYTTHTPVPLDRVKGIIDEASTIAVVPCDCRRLHEDWDDPKSYCVNLDEVAEAALDRGHGERLSKDNAKDLLEWTDEQGLMHCTDQGNGSEVPLAICNCDVQWCYPFRAAEKLGSDEYWPVRVYIASRDEEKCIECGLCAQRCQFDAFEKTSEEGAGGTIQFTGSRCWGCGICATTCPKAAIDILPRDRSQ